MKILIFSDLQATEGYERLYADPTLPLQRYRVEKFLGIAKEIYDRHRCEGVIDLGDTLDDRSSIPVPTINSVLNGIALFPNGFNVKLIGNHEQFTRDARIHVGKLFDKHFTVVDGVAALDAPDTDDIYVFASYPGSYNELCERLGELAHQFRGKRLVLFGHFQVIGAKMHSGQALDGLPRESLMPFKLGFLGHIHKPQEVTHNIFYVGSPFQQNHGESGEDKRVAILDTETLEVTWIPLDAYGFPLYRTVSAREFSEVAQPESEDRFHVVLTSQEDTEALFAHPLCNRAESEYSYTTAQSVTANPAKSWSFEAVLSRWIEKTPPKNVGLDIESPDMLDIGLDIARGSN